MTFPSSATERLVINTDHRPNYNSGASAPLVRLLDHPKSSNCTYNNNIPWKTSNHQPVTGKGKEPARKSSPFAINEKIGVPVYGDAPKPASINWREGDTTMVLSPRSSQKVKKGLRNRQGQFDIDLKKHMRYNLQNDDDLTWDHAINVASRWEAANDFDDDDEDSDSEDEDAIDMPSATATKPTKSSKGKRPLVNALKAEVGEITLGTLALKVEANTNDIKEIKIKQERFAQSINSRLEEQQSTLESMLSSLNAMANPNK